MPYIENEIQDWWKCTYEWYVEQTCRNYILSWER